jgi:hypothetical protein
MRLRAADCRPYVRLTRRREEKTINRKERKERKRKNRRHCERSEAIQKIGASKKHWIASSLSLLAMTPNFFSAFFAVSFFRDFRVFRG